MSRSLQRKFCLPTALVILGGVTPLALARATTVEREAHPEFARLYGLSCTTCHTAVPKLNDFGRRFRANGFQLPGTRESTPIWGRTAPPIGMMVHEMGLTRRVRNRMAVDTVTGIPAGKALNLAGFRNLSLEFFSGGVAADHVSYMVTGEIENELEIEDGGANTMTEVALRQTYFMYNNVLGGNDGSLNFRTGQFELELPFSQIRSFSSEMSDYVAYSMTPRMGGMRLNEPQLGVSAFGRIEDRGRLLDLPAALEYELALVNGTNSSFDANRRQDLYGRAALTLYELGEAVDFLRFGGLLYLGRENLGESNLEAVNSTFLRVGADVTAQLGGGFAVYGQLLLGRHADTDPVNADDQPFNFRGGFLGLEMPLNLEQGLWLYGRYDWIDATRQWDLDPMVVTATGGVDSIDRVTVGGKWYISPNAWVQAEVGQQNNLLGYPEPANFAGRILNVDSRWTMLMFVATF